MRRDEQPGHRREQRRRSPTRRAPTASRPRPPPRRSAPWTPRRRSRRPTWRCCTRRPSGPCGRGSSASPGSAGARCPARRRPSPARCRRRKSQKAGATARTTRPAAMVSQRAAQHVRVAEAGGQPGAGETDRGEAEHRHGGDQAGQPARDAQAVLDLLQHRADARDRRPQVQAGEDDATPMSSSPGGGSPGADGAGRRRCGSPGHGPPRRAARPATGPVGAAAGRPALRGTAPGHPPPDGALDRQRRGRRDQ